MRSSSHSRAPGFSLVEVLFALAIIGLALGATASVFRAGLMGHAAAGDTDTALSLAEAKIAETGAAPALRPGDTQGEFGRFHWHVSVAPFDEKDAAPPTLKLYRVAAIIAWRDGLRQRQFSLATLRLAPAPP